MMRRTSILVLMAAFAGWGGEGRLAAQQGRINPRLAQGQPAKYVQGLCPLRPGHPKVDKAISSLRKAYDAKTAADKSPLLAEAQQNLVSAITVDGQSGNGAAWYYLARVALLQGDPIGADSAFTKAEELVPQCEIDISGYRQNSWAALGQAGIDLQRAGQADSALEQFRDASYLFRGLPHVYANMGVIYANTGNSDSAAVYFERALQVAEADTSLTEDRNSAAQNLALMYIRTNRYPLAIKVLHKSRVWDSAAVSEKQAKLRALSDSLKKVPASPGLAQQVDSLTQQISEIATRLNDTEKTMTISYRNAGMVDSAEVLEARLIAKFSATDLDSLETGDLLTVGVAAFNGGRYPEAERAFGKAAERNPWSRDARYNLAITHLAVSKQARDTAEALRKLAKAPRTSDAVRARAADTTKAQVADTTKLDAAAATAYRGLVTEGIHLVEIDPMNEDALRLLAQGQRGLKQDSAAYKTAERLVALPFSVEITLFQMGMTKANLAADATGRNPMDADGKSLKTAPMILVVEFLDSKGTVLDSKEISVPVLTSGQKHSFMVEGKGPEITAWRYRPKPA